MFKVGDRVKFKKLHETKHGVIRAIHNLFADVFVEGDNFKYSVWMQSLKKEDEWAETVLRKGTRIHQAIEKLLQEEEANMETLKTGDKVVIKKDARIRRFERTTGMFHPFTTSKELSVHVLSRSSEEYIVVTDSAYTPLVFAVTASDLIDQNVDNAGKTWVPVETLDLFGAFKEFVEFQAFKHKRTTKAIAFKLENLKVIEGMKEA